MEGNGSVHQGGGVMNSIHMSSQSNPHRHNSYPSSSSPHSSSSYGDSHPSMKQATLGGEGNEGMIPPGTEQPSSPPPDELHHHHQQQQHLLSKNHSYRAPAHNLLDHAASSLNQQSFSSHSLSSGDGDAGTGRRSSREEEPFYSSSPSPHLGRQQQQQQAHLHHSVLMKRQEEDSSTSSAAAAARLGSSGEGGSGGSGIRELEEQVQNLDADWEELKKLQYLTEEGTYSLDQGDDGTGGRGEGGGRTSTSGLSAESSSLSPTGLAGGVMREPPDEVDRRSVYVGNVDYSSTPAELQEHFKSCGTINRITIMVDKYTGHPKGYAYIEFSSEAAVQNAILLSDTIFKQRQIKVVGKRKNIPGFARGRGGWRGGRMAAAGMMMMMSRGGRGAAMMRGGFRPMYRPRGGFARGYGRPY